MVDLADVRAAAKRIDGRVRRTPVLAAGPDRWFKLEFTQHAGSFKTRGMMNQILAGEVSAAGLIAASGGNAGLAAAYAARELGHQVEVFVPVTAPAVKVAKLGKLGARVVQEGGEYAEAYAAAVVRAAETGARFCHAYDDPAMVAGNGTIGLELQEQVDFDTVLVAVGGGGLVAGLIAAVSRNARIVAVEPVGARALYAALEAGEPVDVGVGGVAADSLGARRIGDIAFGLARTAKIDSVLVDDAAIVEARRRLWDEHRLVVEHGTAAAQAALISGAYRPEPGERVVVLLCGANTDPADLAT
ncbi:threonine dehydratase [Actinoplanes italicus]|uniref:Threonine dehydratase n=1 Tax=Actinoplanes italicus TaxID=113567 RepID=A0A2T0KJ49_9ACTN|nr:serine/threonine dehydratase [Actinoplanes italicus]PRX23552.1 threonine dehydratase [Actinoplanes italicus]GIE30049.1 threonine dehydratase [Actinoplanes italicus]